MLKCHVNAKAPFTRFSFSMLKVPWDLILCVQTLFQTHTRYIKFLRLHFIKAYLTNSDAALKTNDTLLDFS